MIVGNRGGQRIPGQVVVLIGPLGSVGNLVRKCRGSENLGQQRIRIQRDSLY